MATTPWKKSPGGRGAVQYRDPVHLCQAVVRPIGVQHPAWEWVVEKASHMRGLAGTEPTRKAAVVRAEAVLRRNGCHVRAR